MKKERREEEEIKRSTELKDYTFSLTVQAQLENSQLSTILTTLNTNTTHGNEKKKNKKLEMKMETLKTFRRRGVRAVQEGKVRDL